MSLQQQIEQALAEFDQAEAMTVEAMQKFSNARKKLLAIYSPAPVKRMRSPLKEEDITKLLSKKRSHN